MSLSSRSRQAVLRAQNDGATQQVVMEALPRVGDVVDVVFEEELPEESGGGWATQVGRGKVAAVDGDDVTVAWGRGSLDAPYRCHRSHVIPARVAAATSPRPLRVGDVVRVAMEEEQDGMWVRVDEAGVVLSVDHSTGRVAVDWCDGDVPYTTTTDHVALLRCGGRVAKAWVAKPGDRVLVTYEVEGDDLPGTWHPAVSAATVARRLSTGRVRVVWLGTGEEYTCPERDVRPADGASVRYTPGDLVTVVHEEEDVERPGTWLRVRSEAFVRRVLRDGRVEVGWVDTGEVYATPPEHVSFTSVHKPVNLGQGYAFPAFGAPPTAEATPPSPPDDAAPKPGEMVVVTYTTRDGTAASAYATLCSILPDGRVEVVWLPQSDTPFPTNEAYITSAACVERPQPGTLLPSTNAARTRSDSPTTDYTTVLLAFY